MAEGAAFESAVNPTGAPPDSANPWLVVVIVCDVVSPSTTALGLVAPNDWLSADEVVQHSRPDREPTSMGHTGGRSWTGTSLVSTFASQRTFTRIGPDCPFDCVHPSGGYWPVSRAHWS